MNAELNFVFGVNLSEPHTGELNGGLSIVAEHLSVRLIISCGALRLVGCGLDFRLALGMQLVTLRNAVERPR